jgi:hypothetical protein
LIAEVQIRRKQEPIRHASCISKELILLPAYLKL